MTNKIFYILPSYNEGLNFYSLLNNFYKFYKKKLNTKIFLIIINDGSTDNSIKIIKNFIKKNKINKIKIKIIQHKKNLGLGMALKTGFEYCFLKGKKNDVIITMDTDNSHTIILSFQMANQIIFKNKDIVIASRYRFNSKTKGLNQLRKFLSFGAATLYKLFFPIKNVKDYTSGFRAFKLQIIKNAWKKNKNFFSEKEFSASADILLKLYKYRDNIIFDEVPINLRYDLKKGKTKMKIFKTIYLSILLIIKRKFI